MSNLKGKRVLILQQRGWGKTIGRFLAKKLYNEGCKLAAVTFQPALHELIVAQPGVKYDLIISNDEVINDPKSYLAGDEFSLEEICEDLGVDSIWTIMYALRHSIYSYKDKFYFSFRKNMTDEHMTDYIKAVYKYIRLIFNEFNPDVVTAANFVALPHIMFGFYCRKRGIPMFAVSDAKVSGYFIFIQDHFGGSGAFFDKLKELDNGVAKSPNVEKARRYISGFREKFKKPIEGYYYSPDNQTRMQKLRHELHPFVEILRWYIFPQRRTNFIKNIGVTIDYRPPRIILRDHFSYKRYRRFAKNYTYYPFDQLKKFVYFPLQVQPEATIDIMATYYNNQIETARLIAMSLPGDYTLAVKEHPAMLGKRSPSYLEKIARTANVKLIDYRIPSELVLRRADLLIGIGGTTFGEAAMYKKPAIQLGNRGNTLVLPNVFPHSDMTTLSKKIKEVLAVDLNTPEYEKKLINYVAATMDTGFDFNYVAAWERGIGKIEELWEIYKKELTRLLA